MDIFDTTEEKLEYFNLLLSGIYDAHFPSKRIRFKKKGVSWMNKDIHHEISKHNRLHRLFLTTRTDTSWNEFRSFRVAKKDFYHLTKCNSLPTILWKALLESSETKTP